MKAMCLTEYKTIFLSWLVWVCMVLALVQYISARFTLTAPDRVLSWTAGDTGPGGLSTHRYLSIPFMNGHVAWDSEYYLSIALGGYHDPAMQAIPPDFSWKTSNIRP